MEKITKTPNKKGMIFFKRMPVYTKIPKAGKYGKTDLSFFRNKIGVYKIYKDSRLIYVGHSKTNLYKTILRHFQGWNDSNQLDRISYKKDLLKFKFKVQVTLTKTGEDAEVLESALIEKFSPKDNKQFNYHWFNNKYEHKEEYVEECVKCYNEEMEDKKIITDYKTNDKGEILDENGNVLF